MSRSNPSEHLQHPCQNRLEWDGKNGELRQYVKETNQNRSIGADFRFLMLDETTSITGFNKAIGGRIFSNEIKDKSSEVLVVRTKQFKVTEGFYSAIKPQLAAHKAGYCTNVYVGFKGHDGRLELASIRLKRAALGAWIEFCQKNRADVRSKAVHLCGTKEGKNGNIIFKIPVFKICEVSSETEQQAVALDRQLQAYFKVYLAKPKQEQSREAVAAEPADEQVPPEDEGFQEPPPSDDDAPPF